MRAKADYDNGVNLVFKRYTQQERGKAPL